MNQAFREGDRGIAVAPDELLSRLIKARGSYGPRELSADEARYYGLAPESDDIWQPMEVGDPPPDNGA